jgi:ribosomal protein S18 acetylase RimI-like enzyme
MTAFQIRAMTAADVDDVGETTNAGGFGDRREFFRLILTLDDCQPIVGVANGRIIGTGLGAAHGSVGWIGVIFVVPELRRAGIGRAITEAVCERLEKAGCRSLVLVATELGRPVYERLGFREQGLYHMYAGESLHAGPTPPPGSVLRQIRPVDVDAIADLDRRATGEDRRPLIRAFAATGWLLEDAPVGAPPDHIAAAGAGLRGFLLPAARGNAALIADQTEDALCLFDLHRHLTPAGGRAWAGLPTQNEAGRRVLAERGLDAWKTFPRMTRGVEPDWQPSMIWGQFNHAMG